MGSYSITMKPAVLLALLPSLSLSKDIQLRIPQTCRTTSGDSCIFPFTFKGQTFTKCTYTNSPTPWCATMVDQIGNVITNRWGDCDTAGRLSSCETDSRSSSVSSCITKGGPTPNRPCVFPFKHNGRTYSTCTNVSIGKFWCSTATKSDGTHIVGQYGLCPSTCPSSSSDKFTSPSCKPGSTWKKDCNTCICSSSGVTTCTENACSSNNCRTTSGPAQGRACAFPFSFGGKSYQGCARWDFGGPNQGKMWCSTSTDVQGKHINGKGNYGFCSSNCPSDVEVIPKINLDDNAIIFEGSQPS